MKKNIFVAVIVIIMVAALGVWYAVWNSDNTTAPSNIQLGEKPIATAFYMCDGGKTINAEFFKGQSKPAPAPGQPPVPGGSVKLMFSDGPTLTLKQTISADGIRYSNGDPSVQGGETFVFWSKGNGALVLENNEQKTYTGCISVVPDPGNLPKIYESGSNGFSVRYPADYTVDPDYKYQDLGPGKDIYGVSFTIPPSIAKGTNLAPDSYISVEQIPREENCSADLFLAPESIGSSSVATTTYNGIEYSVVAATDAAAGNRYQQIVYAIPGTNPCVAVRYFIHYGVIENYPPGTVKSFDNQALLNQFDAIRGTLTIQQ